MRDSIDQIALRLRIVDNPPGQVEYRLIGRKIEIRFVMSRGNEKGLVGHQRQTEIGRGIGVGKKDKGVKSVGGLSNPIEQ